MLESAIWTAIRPQSSRSHLAAPRGIWLTSVGYQAGLHFPPGRNYNNITRPSGHVLSGERQRAVSGTALDHTAIRKALSGERQRAVSGNALDHEAIRTGTYYMPFLALSG